MAKSKVEKTLRDSLSTINDLRREVKKVRKAGEKALAQQFEKATSTSAAEIKKLRDELDRVRETTAKQIADLTAVVARLAPDLMKSSQASPGPAAEPAPRPAGPDGPVGEPGSDRPHGDPLGAAAAETTPAPVKKAAKKAPVKKAPVKKATAKKAPAKKATSTPQDTTDQRLTLKGEALAASEGVSAIDEDAPGTAPTSAVTVPGDATGAGRPAGAPAKKAPAKKAPASKAAAKKTPAKKTTAKKAPAKKAGATSTAKRTSAPGQKTTARKATAKKAPSTSTPPAATPDNAAVADRPAAD
ncbi:hypothetical protein [Aeromicrobium sp.]|uniref:hypothetical protein n=1 Tax=Aeromicrobium sp. TaxID=1871063 RepID=UPI0028B0754B|nr:hypothetical protein [Aeromicrobium sp.]